MSCWQRIHELINYWGQSDEKKAMLKGENKSIENSRGGGIWGSRFLTWMLAACLGKSVISSRASFSPLLYSSGVDCVPQASASNMKDSCWRSVLQRTLRGWELWAVLEGRGGGAAPEKRAQKGIPVWFQWWWSHGDKNKVCSPETEESNSISSQCVFIECLIRFRWWREWENEDDSLSSWLIQAETSWEPAPQVHRFRDLISSVSPSEELINFSPFHEHIIY